MSRLVETFKTAVFIILINGTTTK